MTESLSGLGEFRLTALRPQDPAALVVFRVLFGLLVSISAIRFLAYDFVEPLFHTQFQLSYWGFSWIPRLNVDGVRLLFALLIPLGALVSLGLFYRVSLASLWLAFTWIQLHDAANYLNHYYLVSLLGLLLMVMPLHRSHSLDVWRKPQLKLSGFPAWCTWLLRFQIGVVYFFAGLAKFNQDWLLRGEPLGTWLSSRSDWPVVGAWFSKKSVALFASWAGFLFDTSAPFFLSWKRTRGPFFLGVIAFHLVTWLLFPIGLFPLIMITSALVFFDPSWPRRALRLPGLPVVHLEQGRKNVHFAWFLAAFTWMGLQIFLPLRTHFFDGNVSWHEQGMRFSWRVMTREKNGTVTFVVRDLASGREWHQSPGDYLTRFQEREMSAQPDLILQMAQHIGTEFRAQGFTKIEVHADSLVSLNARQGQPLIDPSVDLMKISDGLSPYVWVLPMSDEAPIQLNPVAQVH